MLRTDHTERARDLLTEVADARRVYQAACDAENLSGSLDVSDYERYEDRLLAFAEKAETLLSEILAADPLADPHVRVGYDFGGQS